MNVDPRRTVFQCETTGTNAEPNPWLCAKQKVQRKVLLFSTDCNHTGHTSVCVPTSHLKPRLMYCFRAGRRCSQSGSQDQHWKSGLKISDPDCFLRSINERNQLHSQQIFCVLWEPPANVRQVLICSTAQRSRGSNPTKMSLKIIAENVSTEDAANCTALFC